MMPVWTAFFLGLAGSLHCAAMCGPLTVALAAAQAGPRGMGWRPVPYHLGRVATYSILGAAVGFIGATLALAGLQRWISIIAGGVLLLMVLTSSGGVPGWPATRAVLWVKACFAPLLRRRTPGATALLGALNGLLPCGLVYVAAATAASAGSVAGGVAAMLAFGLGTLPMMLGLGLAGKGLRLARRFRAPKLIPLCAALAGGLLILRGLSLGIPYVSPDFSANQGHNGAVFSCHH